MMRMREEWCRYLVVLYSSKIFLQPECLHGASIHHDQKCPRNPGEEAYGHENLVESYLGHISII